MDEVQVDFQLFRVRHRPDVGGGIQCIPHFQCTGTFDESRHELRVNALGDDQP
ncbi:hypothetical protein D3C80_2161340 [compost metagenome]